MTKQKTREIAQVMRENLPPTTNTKAARITEFVQGTGGIGARIRSAQTLQHPDGKEIVLTRLSDTLEEDSASFINYCYRFLGACKCPGDARDIVLVILALTTARFDKFHELEQKDMAHFMGVSVSTVKRKLTALEGWESNIKRTIIEIKKRERGQNAHYKTTRYKPTIARFVGEFMRRVSGQNHHANSLEAKAFTEQTQKFLRAVNENQISLLGSEDLSSFERDDERAVAEDILKNRMPKVNPVQQRKAKQNGNGRTREAYVREEDSEEATLLRARAVLLEKEAKKIKASANKLAPMIVSNGLDALTRAHRRVLDNFDLWCELLRQNGFDLTEALEALQPELQEIINRYSEAGG